MGYSEEHNDCSVRAYATAACVSYDVAHALFKQHGRENTHCTKAIVMDAVMRSTFPNAINAFPSISVTKFLKLYPTGHYIVHTYNHAFAIVDGIIHDWAPGLQRIIKEAWRLDI